MRALWSRKGQALVIVAFGIIALLGAAGLAVDVGSWYLTGQKLQNAADAAALAGATALPGSTSNATSTAVAVAAKNGVTITASDVSFSQSNYIITVNVPGTAPTYFTRVFGMNGVSETRTASATPLNQQAAALRSQSRNTPISLSGSYYINGNVHSNDVGQPVNITGAGGTITGTVGGLPYQYFKPPTWAQLMADKPVVVVSAGDADGATGDQTDANSCTFTTKLDDGTFTSLNLPTSGTIVFIGNVIIDGNLNMPNLSLVTWGGNFTMDGTGKTAYTVTFNNISALNNTFLPSGSTCSEPQNQGNVTIGGNVTVTVGNVWGDQNVSLSGNPAISDGSVTGYTISLSGHPKVSWNPQPSDITGDTWLVP